MPEVKKIPQDNPATIQQEVYQRYDAALETLCFRVLGEPYNAHKVEHRISAPMLKGLHGEVIAECLEQFRTYREYTPQSVAVALGREKSNLVAWAQRDAEIELPFAFQSFLHAYEQFVEVQIADSVRAWVSKGLSSLEIRQEAEKLRRTLGLSDLKESGDGKKEFEKQLLSALDGRTEVYPVKPPLEAIRRGVPYWEPGEYIILAGRTGMGKSYLGLNALYENAKIGMPGLYVNLENTPKNVQKRLWQFETGVRFQTFSGLSDRQINEYLKAWETVKKMPIVSAMPGNSLSAVVNTIRQAHYEKGIQIAVIDYVQLVRSGGRDRVAEIETISAELRALALDLNIVVAAVAQLSRETEKRADKRPQLSDLKGSGGLEQDATGVYLLYRPEYYDILTDDEGAAYPPGYADIFIAKGRETGPGLVKCRFDPVRGFYDENEFSNQFPAAPVQMPRSEEVPF